MNIEIRSGRRQRIESYKRGIVEKNLCIIFVCIIASFYYYYCLLNTSIPFHSDDAGSTFALMDDKFFGGHSYLYKIPFSIFTLLERLSCYFFGYTEFATRIVFCIQFFIMLYLTALILIDKQDAMKIVVCKLLYLVWFSALLGVEGVAEIQISKFHTGPTIILLLILLVEKRINNITKKRIAIVLLSIMVILQGDYILGGCVVIIPLILWYIRNHIELKNIIRFGIMVSIFLSSICVIAYMVCSMKDLPYVPTDLYGNRVFSSVQDIIDNVSVYFNGLFGMFNCQIIRKPIISAIFLPRFIKCIFICCGLIYTGWYLVKKKQKNVQGKELCCIVVVVVTVAFIMTGAQGDIISMRYCQCLLFVLPIIEWDIVVFLYERYIEQRYMIVGFVILGASQLVIVNPNTNFYKYEDLTEALADSNILTAVAPYWSSNVVSIISEGSILVQPCEIREGELFESNISTLSLYKDKATEFNTIISSVCQNGSYDETVFGMVPESIIEIYGYPVEQIVADDYHNIYIYDYDIRNIPEYFKEEDDGRFYIEGDFLGIYEISIMNIGREVQLQLEGGEIIDRYCVDGWQKILVNCNEKQEKLAIDIENVTEQEKESLCIVLKTISESQNVEIEGVGICKKDRPYLGKKGQDIKSKTMLLNQGNYKLVIYGDNLKDVEIATDTTEMQIEQGESGVKRKIYYLYVEDAADAEFQIMFDADAEITNFSVEVNE